MSYRRDTLAKSQFKRSTRKRNQRRRKNVTGAPSKKMVLYKGFKSVPGHVTYMANGQNPFPRSYRTKLTTSIYGFVAAGGVAAGARYYVRLNSAYAPWAGGSWPNGAPSIAALNPAGYSSIINANLYNSVRVYGSSITVEFLPQALTDTIICTVTPSNASTLPLDVDDALAQPYTKQLFMSSSKMNSARGSMIKNYITQHKFLGVTAGAIQNDLSGNYTHGVASYPVETFYWVVNIATPDATALATPLEYKCKVTYYVECYNETAPRLIQT